MQNDNEINAAEDFDRRHERCDGSPWLDLRVHVGLGRKHVPPCKNDSTDARVDRMPRRELKSPRPRAKG